MDMDEFDDMNEFACIVNNKLNVLEYQNLIDKKIDNDPLWDIFILSLLWGLCSILTYNNFLKNE